MHVRMFPSLEVDVEEELKRYQEYAEKLRPLVIETVSYIHNELKKGKRILVEGANAAMLDIDFGKYIYRRGLRPRVYLFGAPTLVC